MFNYCSNRLNKFLFMLFSVILIIIFSSTILEAAESSQLSISQSFQRALNDNPHFELDHQRWNLIENRYSDKKDLTLRVNMESELIKKDELGLYGPGLLINTDITYDDIRIDIPVRYRAESPGFAGINMQTEILDDLDLNISLLYDQVNKESFSLGIAKPILPSSVSDIDSLSDKRSLLNARLNLLESENRLLFSVIDAYTAVLRAEKDLLELNVELENAERDLRIIEREVERGKSPRRNLESAEDRMRELEIDVKSAENSIFEVREHLASLLGLEIFQLPEKLKWSSELEVESHYIDLGPDLALELAFENRIDYQITDLNIRFREKQLQRLESEGEWKLGVEAEYNTGFRAGEEDYTASIWASKSILDPGLKENLKEAQINLSSAELAFESKRAQIENEVQNAYRSVDTTELRTYRAEKNLDYSVEALEAAEKEFNRGLITENEKQTREFERDMREKELSLAVFSELRTHLEILEVLGIPFTDAVNIEIEGGLTDEFWSGYETM